MTTLALSRIRKSLVIGRLLPFYVLVAILKHFVPLQLLAQWAWRAPAAPRNREAEGQLAARVVRLSHLMGVTDRDCLQRSLLLYRVLSRAGADPTLVVGFERLDSRILGHAWVVVDGRALLELDTDLCRFSRALNFGSRGVLMPHGRNPAPV
jgi:Transglutaminase-like superfamily